MSSRSQEDNEKGLLLKRKCTYQEGVGALFYAVFLLILISETVATESKDKSKRTETLYQSSSPFVAETVGFEPTDP